MVMRSIKSIGGMRVSAFCLLALSITIASCVQEELVDDSEAGLITREFDASFIDEGTKTTFVGGGKVQWNSGDVIRYYSEDNGNVRELSVSKDGASAHLSLKTSPSASYVAAVYGAESLTSVNSSSVVLEGVVREEQSGRFEDAHVSAAFTRD